MLQLTRILVPIDFSKESDLALRWAIRLAQGEAHASIHLCHVIPEMMAPSGPDAMVFETPALYQRQIRSNEQALENLRKTIQAPIVTSSSVGKGPIVPEILRLCQTREIDLIVIATHGRHGFQHILYGSVAESLVRLAPCPVLVLHLNDEKTATLRTRPKLRKGTSAALSG